MGDLALELLGSTWHSLLGMTTEDKGKDVEPPMRTH